MIVGYVIAGLVLLVIMVTAYRALGRPSAPVSDPAALLGTVLATAGDATASLREAEAVRAAQRRLEGCALALERIDATTLSADGEAAHELLTQGVNELIWAARLSEKSGLASAGLKLGFEALHSSGSGCLERAGQLLGGSVPAEEGHRPG